MRPTTRNRRTAGTLAALLALAGLGAACSDDAAALTPQEWATNANAVCVAGSDRAEVAYETLADELDDAGRTEPTAAQTAEIYEFTLADIERQIEEIDALEAPAAIQADVEAFLTAAEDGLAVAIGLDPTVVFAGAQDPFEDATAIARDLGLADCGDDPEDTPTVPSVEFAYPNDGAEVTSPVALTLAADGFTVEAAGEVRDGAGHLHVMVDVPCVPAGQPVPRDEQHLHFGDGQTGVQVDLDPGRHTLCLQAADGAHIALDLTDEVTLEVVGSDR